MHVKQTRRSREDTHPNPRALQPCPKSPRCQSRQSPARTPRSTRVVPCPRPVARHVARLRRDVDLVVHLVGLNVGHEDRVVVEHDVQLGLQLLEDGRHVVDGVLVLFLVFRALRRLDTCPRNFERPPKTPQCVTSPRGGVQRPPSGLNHWLGGVGQTP